MKRISILILSTFIQVMTFAQRGRGFRPEWDMERSHSYHNIDDDMYSFLFIIGIILVVFIIAAIKGHNKKNKTKQSYKPSKAFGVIGKIGDVYNTIVGGGCLIGMIIAPIAFLIIFVIDCVHDSSREFKEKAEQRKEKTMVNTIYSETDYKQSHIALQDEFIGKDTVFYYKNYVYQNMTGRTLALYSVEYCINGTKTVETIKTISPNAYFDTGLRTIIPFKKPPQSVDILIPTGHSRWAKSQRTKATRKEYFIDYLDFVSKIKIE